MYEDVPSWLRPFLKPGAYSPSKQFLVDLVPQSRIEAILKYGFLSATEVYSDLLDADGKNFIDADDKNFLVLN